MTTSARDVVAFARRMTELQFRPLDGCLVRQLRFGVALFAVLAAFSGLLWFVGRHPEPQVSTPQTSNMPVADVRSALGTAQAGNIQIGWGFSDRWFPMIQAVPPSVSPERSHTAEGAADELVLTHTE